MVSNRTIGPVVSFEVAILERDEREESGNRAEKMGRTENCSKERRAYHRRKRIGHRFIHKEWICCYLNTSGLLKAIFKKMRFSLSAR
jgi:hypothetical protein